MNGDLTGTAATRRGFLRSVAGAAAASSLASCSGSKADPNKPNIVIVLADDFGIDMVTSYGAEHTADMPRIEALGKAGLRFVNAYSTPLCSPSRVELLTGRYPFRSGFTENILDRVSDPPDSNLPTWLDSKEFTFAKLLKSQGYVTGVMGKWQLCYFDEHPDHCRDLGFDEHCVWLWIVKDEKTGSWVHSSRNWVPSVLENGVRKFNQKGLYGPDVHCDYAIDFMRRHRDQPFLAYVPLVLPHPPYQLTPNEVDPATMTEEPGVDTSYYRRHVAYMDKIVGRLVDAVNDLGLAKRTLFLFTSDNGTPGDVTVKFRGVTRQGGKDTLSEAGSRVPLIAWWEGVTEAGKVTPQLVDLSDFLPTIAEVCGAPLPPDVPLDGKTFAPLLRGAQRGNREFVFSMLGEQSFARERVYKLYSDGRFFDAVSDPEETKDLANAPRHQAEREKLARAINGLRR